MKPEQTVIFSDFNVCIFSIYSTVKNNLPLLVSLVQLNICNLRGGWGWGVGVGGGAKIQQFQKLHLISKVAPSIVVLEMIFKDYIYMYEEPCTPPPLQSDNTGFA